MTAPTLPSFALGSLPPEPFMRVGRRPGAKRASASMDGGGHVRLASDCPIKEAAAAPVPRGGPSGLAPWFRASRAVRRTVEQLR
jgi:hypothetical protein